MATEQLDVQSSLVDINYLFVFRRNILGKMERGLLLQGLQRFAIHGAILVSVFAE